MPYTWNGNLPYLGEVNVTLNIMNTPPGNHVLSVSSALPGDQRPANDVATLNYNADGQFVEVRITTDANPGQTTWTIFGPAPGFPVYEQGGPFFVANSTVTSTHCLPSGNRYNFSVSDGGLNGGASWELRDAFGRTVLRDNGTYTGVSPVSPTATVGYGTTHEVHLPLGPSRPWTAAPYAVCGNFAMGIQSKVRCTTVAGVSQYQFDFSNPNAGYRRRLTSPVNYVLWTAMGANAPQLGVTYFVRMRADQGAAGFSDDNWGAGCEMAWATTNPGWCTGLVSTPGTTLSCGVTRTWGGSSKLWATPVPGAVPYDIDADGQFNTPGDQQFAYHFRITGTGPLSGYLKDAWMTNYILPLNWSTLPMNQPGVYNVQVRVQVGGVWQPFCGSTCQVTIVAAGPMQGGNDRITETATSEELQLWPNPVRDGRVNLRVEGLTATDERITVDMFDAYGKRVVSKQIPGSGTLLNTTLELNSLATGMYVVTVTAGEQQFAQRLVVQ